MDKVIHEQVRMILTEEELNNHLSYIERHKSTIHQEVVKSLLNNIGYSHKALIEANAELSFKLQDFAMWKTMTLQFTTEEEARRIYKLIQGMQNE